MATHLARGSESLVIREYRRAERRCAPQGSEAITRLLLGLLALADRLTHALPALLA